MVVKLRTTGRFTCTSKYYCYSDYEQRELINELNLRSLDESHYSKCFPWFEYTVSSLCLLVLLESLCAHEQVKRVTVLRFENMFSVNGYSNIILNTIDCISHLLSITNEHAEPSADFAVGAQQQATDVRD